MVREISSQGLLEDPSATAQLALLGEADGSEGIGVSFNNFRAVIFQVVKSTSRALCGRRLDAGM